MSIVMLYLIYGLTSLSGPAERFIPPLLLDDILISGCSILFLARSWSELPSRWPLLLLSVFLCTSALFSLSTAGLYQVLFDSRALLDFQVNQSEITQTIVYIAAGLLGVSVLIVSENIGRQVGSNVWRLLSIVTFSSILLVPLAWKSFWGLVIGSGLTLVGTLIILKCLDLRDGQARFVLIFSLSSILTLMGLLQNL